MEGSGARELYSIEVIKAGRILGECARNAAMAVPAVSRWRAARARTAPAPEHLDREYLETYAYGIYERSVRAAGAVEGKRVCEIGPGDHLGVALLMLAGGAESYTAIDRFRGGVSSPAAKRFYAALIDDLRRHEPEMHERLGRRGICAEDFPERCELVSFRNVSIEQAGEAERFDLVVSNNVVEHVSDMGAFARALGRMLRPGGVAVHRVDFGPHNWMDLGYFEWLRISDATWRWMGSHRGYPNRKRFHELCAEFESAGLKLACSELNLLDTELTEREAERLPPRFRAMPLESLRVLDAVIECRL